MIQSVNSLMLAATMLTSLGSAAAQSTAPTSPADTSAAPPNPGPKIQFAEPTFDFGKVESGQLIRHDFTFTNSGDQVLEIRDVRPSCGCTMTGAYERKVEPGKSGRIPVRFDSSDYKGEVVKTIIVVCNDRTQTNLILQMKGVLWRPIEVTPSALVFAPSSDCETNQVRLARIVSNLDEPVALSEPECANPAFRSSLKTVRPGKEFEFKVTFIPPAGFTNATVPITLKTSSLKVPALTITAHAMVQPAVMAVPSQLTLPAGPLAGGAELKVTIRNNGSRPLVLSEPGASAPEVMARLQEVQPGRSFILALSFPAGFEVRRGQSVEARVKTNHRQFPELLIPVRQGQSLARALETVAPGARESNISPQRTN